MDIKSALKELCRTVGVAGEEYESSAKAAEMLKKYAKSVNIDAMGNVTAFIEAEDKSAKTVMLDAHIDRIGFIVTQINEDGFVKIGAVGGPDLRIMSAQSVTIHGKEPVLGVVSALPPHVMTDHTKVAEIGEISLDTGFTKEQAEKLISQGDKVTINSEFRELSEDIISAAAIDDRAGVCAILAALDMLEGRKPGYNVAVCFSAQEETGERGAKTAAFELQPDEALAVDVSFAKTPDSDPKDTAEMGSGVMIGISAALSREMSDKLISLAEKAEIPFTREVMPSSTGTNADSIAVSRGGVKCCTLSIPIRYMHTPVETVNLKDIESTARLIFEYIGGEGK